jgi:hypothetical protein
MGALFLSFSHPPPILLVGLLVLFTQHLAYGSLPLTFEQYQGQTESLMRFSHRYRRLYCLPTNANAVEYLATRTDELWGKEKGSFASAPSKWPKFAPTYGKEPLETTYRIEDLEHYGRNIPWAGSIILRICQQANAHPHFVRALTILKPRF